MRPKLHANSTSALWAKYAFSYFGFMFLLVNVENKKRSPEIDLNDLRKTIYACHPTGWIELETTLLLVQNNLFPVGIASFFEFGETSVNDFFTML